MFYDNYISNFSSIIYISGFPQSTR